MQTKLKQHLQLAVDWLSNIAQIKDNKAVGRHGNKFPYRHWNGAIRGEYSVAEQTWDCYCPIWHTGQAVKALVLAAEALDKPELLSVAKFSAEFILNNQLVTGNDKGLILAYEDHADKVNTSAILETVDGLFYLAQATDEIKYTDAALDALYWVANNAWEPQKKTFHDLYESKAKKFIFGIRGAQGRPLLDDAVFVRGFLLLGEPIFKQIAIDTAETLLKNEYPAGNWLTYIPCNKALGAIHPRHAYWWGKSMLPMFKLTNQQKYYDCFMRSITWYKNAMRHDGGFIRRTYTDFNTDSLGHATSGSACAVISFLEYYQYSQDKDILQYIDRGLKYCMQMQFTEPADCNLKGAILEKILPPNGSDKSPYHIRDLGTIFFIQAAALKLITDNSIPT
jgi:hypothetical protein